MKILMMILIMIIENENDNENQDMNNDVSLVLWMKNGKHWKKIGLFEKMMMKMVKPVFCFYEMRMKTEEKKQVLFRICFPKPKHGVENDVLLYA